MRTKLTTIINRKDPEAGLLYSALVSPIKGSVKHLSTRISSTVDDEGEDCFQVGRNTSILFYTLREAICAARAYTVNDAEEFLLSK